MGYLISGNLVDIMQERIYPASLLIENNRITAIQEETRYYSQFILPGLIDSHIHIESSMLCPSSFAKMLETTGTMALVCDPHEIANVKGIPGIDFMIENARESGLYFFFGAPSCVPATLFETNGAVIGSHEIGSLLKRNDIYFLGEMMNFPGVLNQDPEVMDKLDQARKMGKPIDGHAPGLTGKDLDKYIQAGISTDHESLTLAEAREKIRKGMKIQIRHGSSTSNFALLYPLLEEFPDHCMLCSDDLHPHDLLKGHINRLLQMGLQTGVSLWNLLKAATRNPIQHYRLPCGSLQVGDKADFIVTESLRFDAPLTTYIRGKVIQPNQQLINPAQQAIYSWKSLIVSEKDLQIPFSQNKSAKVIRIIPNSLITEEFSCLPLMNQSYIQSDTKRDILKLCCMNRYEKKPLGMGLVSGFCMQTGAIASSVAHDSHNILAVGCSDEEIAQAIRLVQANHGGLSLVSKDGALSLSLPIAGLMSSENGQTVAGAYSNLLSGAQKLGCSLQDPFMTLSFLSLLVIPSLKLSDRGLFDVNRFAYTSLES